MQQLQVISTGEGHRLRRAGDVGVDWDVGLVNAFLAQLGVRCFSPATVRAYAYDLLNFLRFLLARGATLADVVPSSSSPQGRVVGGQCWDTARCARSP